MKVPVYVPIPAAFDPNIANIQNIGNPDLPPTPNQNMVINP
jgi:hypothetical protein